jgi:hypothetical protein
VSRTERVTTNSALLAAPGPRGEGIRPRDGLSPTMPHHAAGMRIEPAPSFACATGTSPEATAAQAPPEDPPADRSSDHGLRVGPNAIGCVVDCMPNSGVRDTPTVASPDWRNSPPSRESPRAR